MYVKYRKKDLVVSVVSKDKPTTTTGYNIIEADVSEEPRYIIVSNHTARDMTEEEKKAFDDTRLKLAKKLKLQEIKKDFVEASEKPRVEVQLSDTLTITVDGGRTNKDDFKEEWENMAADATTTVRDADNVFHDSITKDQMYLIYKAIIANGKALYLKKWDLETQIENAKLEELEDIRW